MARHETMPEIIYQKQLQISANRDNLSSTDSSEVKEPEKERRDETPDCFSIYKKQLFTEVEVASIGYLRRPRNGEVKIQY